MGISYIWMKGFKMDVRNHDYFYFGIPDYIMRVIVLSHSKPELCALEFAAKCMNLISIEQLGAGGRNNLPIN